MDHGDGLQRQRHTAGPVPVLDLPSTEGRFALQPANRRDRLPRPVPPRQPLHRFPEPRLQHQPDDQRPEPGPGPCRRRRLGPNLYAVASIVDANGDASGAGHGVFDEARPFKSLEIRLAGGRDREPLRQPPPYGLAVRQSEEQGHAEDHGAALSAAGSSATPGCRSCAAASRRHSRTLPTIAVLRVSAVRPRHRSAVSA